MFGVLRTILALMVMVSHLFLPLPQLGSYSVFGFYIISGYLMTLVMQESYGYTRDGKVAFAFNRFLRLYPLYWISLLLSIALIVYLGGERAGAYHGSLKMPGSSISWIENIFMMFPSNMANPRLVPPSWALTVEIFFYVCICAGLSKTLPRVQLWFVLSICYVMWTFFNGMPWSDRYYPFAAGSLPFSIGSGIYFYTNKPQLWASLQRLGSYSPHLFLSILTNIVVWMALSRVCEGLWLEVGFYINIVLVGCLVIGIVAGGQMVPVNKRFDKILGDYSYPIYLFHWQAGLITSVVIFGEPLHGFTPRGFVNLMAALVVIIPVSFLVIKFVDLPVQKLRNKIRPKGI